MREVKMKYSIIIPVYNGSRYLEKLYFEIKKVFSRISPEYEVIFVDDGSLDNSWEVMKKIYCVENSLKIIKLSKNYGQHNATLCGLRNAKGEILITLDQDLQHPPSEIPKLIEELNRGKMLVYAKYLRKKHPFLQNIGSLLVNKIIMKITGSGGKISSFRVFRREIVDYILNLDNPDVIIDIFFAQVISSKEISYVPIKHKANLVGKSNYDFWKLSQIAANMIFNHTVLPLRVVSIFGFLISTFSFFLFLYYSALYLMGKILVPGFTMIILTLFFSLGILLLVLGIFGEYLGRIFLISIKKPQYRIREMEK